MDPVNETALLQAVPLLVPLFEKIRLFVLSVQWMFGGLFGLYLLMVYLRWREARQTAKILKEIRDDIKDLTKVMKKKH